MIFFMSLLQTSYSCHSSRNCFVNTLPANVRTSKYSVSMFLQTSLKIAVTPINCLAYTVQEFKMSFFFFKMSP